MMLSAQGGGGRFLFTALQWQELENQALIYKYMAAGMRVPSELVLPLRHRDGFGLDTAPSLALYPSQPALGWGCYGTPQYGRKPEDPEPGRCRRTDGKKWRCSREAHGESKYCEKHMHRGKNRSRKPVETMPTPSSAYRPSALSISPPKPDAPAYHRQLHLDAPSPPPSYHRFAPPPHYFPGGGYREHEEMEARRRQHYLALGADLSLDKPDAAAASAEKPLRRFLDDWPRGNGDGRQWMGVGQDETQLSISIPTAAPDLAAASRYHHRNADE